MRSWQRRVTRVLMGLVMFVTGTYVGVDWASFFYHFHSPYSPRAGYARTVLCAVLAFLVGEARVDDRDRRSLQAAFALTLVADFFLILADQMLPGTLLFALVHGILIYRHARGLGASLAPPERARTVLLLLASAVVVYGGTAALLAAVRPVLARTHMLAIDAAYLLILATSLWMAWGALLRRAYPERNGWYVALGMTCFYFCDVTVGLAAALGGRPSGQILGNLVGFFYSPALVLLAFSGYRWRARDDAQPALEPIPAQSS